MAFGAGILVLQSYFAGTLVLQSYFTSHLSTAAGLTSAGGSIGKRSGVLNSNTLQLILISMQRVVETWAVWELKEVRSGIELNQGNRWQEVVLVSSSHRQRKAIKHMKDFKSFHEIPFLSFLFFSL